MKKRKTTLSFKDIVGFITGDLHENLRNDLDMVDLVYRAFKECRDESEKDEMLRSLKREFTNFLKEMMEQA